MKHSDNIITQREICICTKTWRYKRGNYDLRFLEYSGMFVSGESREEGLKVMVWNVVWRVDIGQIQILCTTLTNFNNRITGRFETWQRLDLMCFREMILAVGSMYGLDCTSYLIEWRERNEEMKNSAIV